MHTVTLQDESTVQLDPFTRAYIEVALWATNDDRDESEGEPLDASCGPEDFSPEAMAKVIEDCRKFQEENGELIANDNYLGRIGENDVNELAGHDFFLTRCGHGAGFWDGDWEQTVGEKLTAASKRFGEVHLYVGDDGMLYI